jgi:hypothetical protein
MSSSRSRGASQASARLRATGRPELTQQRDRGSRAPERSRVLASRAGLRRVDWVRLLVDDGHLRAEAVGVGFRLPVTRPISLSVAAELIAAGTPHVTHSAECQRDDPVGA